MQGKLEPTDLKASGTSSEIQPVFKNRSCTRVMKMLNILWKDWFGFFLCVCVCVLISFVFFSLFTFLLAVEFCPLG